MISTPLLSRLLSRVPGATPAPQRKATSELDDLAMPDMLSRPSNAVATGLIFGPAPEELVEAMRVKPTPAKFNSAKSSEGVVFDPAIAKTKAAADAQRQERETAEARERDAVLARYGISSISKRPQLRDTLSRLIVELFISALVSLFWRATARSAWASRIAGALAGVFAMQYIPAPLSAIGFAFARLPRQLGVFAGHSLDLASAIGGSLVHVFLAGALIFFVSWILTAFKSGRGRLSVAGMRSTGDQAAPWGGWIANGLEALAWAAIAATIASVFVGG
ncbi:hypothetical protein LA345_13355 [Burkholderia vietnamiensis]|uniref:Uncharacterized protein n=1 Tax=Burkholderia vietnamiensis (strain G4 / LMG 22486) TaxID=269482 RepID=A4JFU2_BURVG|nr:hypothetical protein Bcep1808_2143 [Burkholderia vietnamiensis G4]MCB4344901.1 hypothetical protein [Burkholderia vietnamiensis]